MSFLDEELGFTRPGQRGASRGGAWFARIAKTITDLNELAYVTLPAFSATLTQGPARWQPRADVSFPSEGDECLVMWDDQGQLWILVWWPV